MSQFGALANAQEGWTAEKILHHYYPGATLGTVPANTVAIRLTAQDDSTLDAYADAGLRVAGRSVAAGQAAHLTPLPGGRANVVVTLGCDGDVLWQAATEDPWVYPIDPKPGRPAAEHLTLCGGSAYRGALGVATENGAPRTVNRVDLEDYLLGVVPAEVQANWADKGGVEALRAQAIAARSYVLAEQRYSYAQSCDTTDCQVYPGTAKEDSRAAGAVGSTAGTVLLRDGRILRSEYSSAPGGGEPADIYTFEVGPALRDLAPGAPDVPLDPRKQAAVGESPIEVEYRRIGGAASKVGQPLGPEMSLPEHAGTYRLFTNGVIIATPTLGAQVVDFTTLLQLVPDPAGLGGPSGSSAPSGPVEAGVGVPPVPAGAGAPSVPVQAEAGVPSGPVPAGAGVPSGPVPAGAGVPSGPVPAGAGAPSAPLPPVAGGQGEPVPSGAGPQSVASDPGRSSAQDFDRSGVSASSAREPASPNAVASQQESASSTASVPSAPNVPSQASLESSGQPPRTFVPSDARPSADPASPNTNAPAAFETADAGAAPMSEAVQSAADTPGFETASSGVASPSASPGRTLAPTTAATPTPRPTPVIPIPSGGATRRPLAPGSSEFGALQG
ncbi:SpoIID/LytB domain-containing protein [Nocardia tenerifensis]|nr:SpoIID/LytB domain-containing protein [Nocardia tenerifensis]